MSPYIVRDASGGHQATAPMEIPSGAPVLSRNRFLDALQTGTLLEHDGKKFTTGLMAHGEPGPGGFVRLTIGYSISW